MKFCKENIHDTIQINYCWSSLLKSFKENIGHNIVRAELLIPSIKLIKEKNYW